MSLAIPCPHCRQPITRWQFLSTTSLTFRCRSCQTILHYKAWVWGVLAVVLLALFGALAGIGFDAILADRAARATMRLVFLIFLIFSLGVSLVVFALNPFTVRNRA